MIYPWIVGLLVIAIVAEVVTYRRCRASDQNLADALSGKLSVLDWGLLAGNPEEEFEVAYLRLLQELYTTMMRKRADYGPGNIRLTWLPGIVVRKLDKNSRLANLVLEGHTAKVNESIKDTFMDDANYSLYGALMVSGVIKPATSEEIWPGLDEVFEALRATGLSAQKAQQIAFILGEEDVE